MFTVPPQSAVPAAGIDPAALSAEIDAKLPGLTEHMEPDAPGMHTTETIDFEYVISGRVVLELDDGATATLGPGDTVVQNGTRHAWRNPFDEPCRMVVVIIGAERKS
jgi:mannose-6-phosphate isomerase-like protein (cupin superfamily)